MRVPLEWLHEYCAPHMDAYTLAERLALSGRRSSASSTTVSARLRTS